MQRRQGYVLEKSLFGVVHDTGNPDSTAKGNIAFYRNSAKNNFAGAQIFVDDKEIRECIPYLTGKPERANHVIYNVTTDNQMFGDDANDVAPGVEYCYGPSINAEEAYKRYVWVCAYCSYIGGFSPKSWVGHFILDPKRKIDPRNGLSKSGRTYDQLLKDIVSEYNECVGAGSQAPAKTATKAQVQTSVKSSGDTQIKTIQDTLNSRYRYKVKVDGKFGRETKLFLLSAFQTELNKQYHAGLKVDGKWGSKTKAAAVPVKKGAKGNLVWILQAMLYCLDFDSNRVDGVFGPGTEVAVKNFQHSKKIKQNGVTGVETWSNLFN